MVRLYNIFLNSKKLSVEMEMKFIESTEKVVYDYIQKFIDERCLVDVRLRNIIS